METQEDFKELCALFNAHDVAYLIVGGYALAHHGSPRYTGDMDILIRADVENARRILAALAEFGFASLGLQIEDFSTEGRVAQFGVPPVRVDILTSNRCFMGRGVCEQGIRNLRRHPCPLYQP